MVKLRRRAAERYQVLYLVCESQAGKNSTTQRHNMQWHTSICLSDFLSETALATTITHTQELAINAHSSQQSPQHARLPHACAPVDKNTVVDLGHGVVIDKQHHLYSDVGECVVPDSICFCLLTNNHVTRSESSSTISHPAL